MMLKARRPGYALLAVLWMVAGVSSVALGISLIARGSVSTSRNRLTLTALTWEAEGCLARAHAAMEPAMRAGHADAGGSDPWPRLDTVVERSMLVAACAGSVEVYPAGIAVDLNTVSFEMLRRLFVRQGYGETQADSLSDALLDWRDPDDTPRGSGAERDWYLQAGRLPPRNESFANVRELAYVRGFDEWTDQSDQTRDPLGTLFTVEPGRVVLELAPSAVLAGLPGLTEEAMERIGERRMRQAAPLTELLDLGAELSASGRDSLHQHHAELVRLVTVQPEAWIVVARSPRRAGVAPASLEASIEARMVRSGPRVAIVRLRRDP